MGCWILSSVLYVMMYITSMTYVSTENWESGSASSDEFVHGLLHKYERDSCPYALLLHD